MNMLADSLWGQAGLTVIPSLRGIPRRQAVPAGASADDWPGMMGIPAAPGNPSLALRMTGKTGQSPRFRALSLSKAPGSTPFAEVPRLRSV
jgi:hypothetical protein